MEEIVKLKKYILEKGTNLKFLITQCSLSGLSGNQSLSYFEKDDKVVFLGEVFDTSQQKDIQKLNAKLYKLFQLLTWFTYRKKLQPILGKLKSDTGWGCMIRAGQMIYFEALRRFVFKKNAHDIASCMHNLTPTQDKLIPLLLLFTDCEYSSFSIQNIAKRAYQYFKLYPGEWYTPNRICYILKILHEQKIIRDQKYSEENAKLNEKQQEFKYEYMKNDFSRLCFWSQNNDIPLILHKLLSQFCGPNTNLCENKTHQDFQKRKFKPIVCNLCHKSNKSMLLLISCRIGVESPEKEYLVVLNKLLELKQSLGFIGGRPKQALYFPGRINDEYIYLDPHYVQLGTNQYSILENNIFKTYFTDKIQTHPSSGIDSSLAIGFYLEDIFELEDFYQSLLQIKQDYPQFFIWLEREKPSYMEDSQEEDFDQFDNSLEDDDWGNFEENMQNQDGQNFDQDYYFESDSGSMEIVEAKQQFKIQKNNEYEEEALKIDNCDFNMDYNLGNEYISKQLNKQDYIEVLREQYNSQNFVEICDMNVSDFRFSVSLNQKKISQQQEVQNQDQQQQQQNLQQQYCQLKDSEQKQQLKQNKCDNDQIIQNQQIKEYQIHEKEQQLNIIENNQNNQQQDKIIIQQQQQQQQQQNEENKVDNCEN